MTSVLPHAASPGARGGGAPSSPRGKPRFRRAGFWVAAGLLAWFGIHLTLVAIVGMRDDLRRVDCAVVLGNGVEPDGMPGSRLRRRLDRAAELYRQGLFGRVIVSGTTDGRTYNEPAAMRRYLIAQGVPAASITEDAGGHNTMLTAANTRRIMAERGWGSVLAISDYFHLPRVRVALWRAGVGDVRTAHVRASFSYDEAHALLRGFPAFYWYLVRSVPGA